MIPPANHRLLIALGRYPGLRCHYRNNIKIFAVDGGVIKLFTTKSFNLFGEGGLCGKMRPDSTLSETTEE